MTDFIQLPEHVDPTTLDVAQTIAGIEAGTLGLDWTEVRTVDHDVLRELLPPFVDRVEEFGDALGVMTMPDAIEPDVNWVLGLGPEPAPPAERRSAPGERAEAAPSAPLPGMDLTTPSGIRDAFHDLIALDLLGPALGPEEELVDDPPRTRYVVGTLAPKDAAPDALVDDDPLEGPGEKGETEGSHEPAASTTLFSSSVGFTFAVAPGVDSIRVHTSWGVYDRVQSDLHETPEGQPKMVWKRIPSGGTIELTLEPRRLDPILTDADYSKVTLQGIVRPAADDGTVMVTLFLVNEQTVAEEELLKDRKWVFQPEITVDATDGASGVFVRRDHLADLPEDPSAEEVERAMLEMVHRRHAEFAMGHGIGVHADPAGDPWLDDAGWDRAIRIRTAVLPSYDVPVTETPTDEEFAADFDGFDRFELDMERLATLERSELVTELRKLPATYQQWIDQQRARVPSAPDLENHRASAARALDAAEKVRQRLDEGVDLIESDRIAFESFQFANRAMRLQRLRSIYALGRRRGDDRTFEDVAKSESARWRAFQLAFLVLNVPTVVDLGHERRTSPVASYADLLWFPTGGGKTEAYLGVAALSIGARRLQGTIDEHLGDAGVTVIMRYTLRLLTLQQFQRAATLVCAMEQIRKTDVVDGTPKWGTEPFRIGLWIGNSSTPGTTEGAAKWVSTERGNKQWDASAGTSSPLQLTNCPWCGARLGPNDVKCETYASGRGRTIVSCRDRQCDFNGRNSPDEGIPVVTVDEEIYRFLPTFLLATVDKFAQMPWRGEVQSLFGRVAGRCERHGWLGTDAGCSGTHPKSKHGGFPAVTPGEVPANGLRPPDLIIQDELHLISGPLGTLVGLYETAIDELCSWSFDGQVVRPKIIAATATTRRAGEQVHKLFCRQVEVFPPSGLESRDNFFARQRPPGPDKPGRRYMGVCAPGRSRPAVLIRVYVALLAASQWLWDNVAEEHRPYVDPYMTLLGYFNSLRELGGMRRLVDDDVTTRAFRVERGDRPGMAQRVMYPETVQELTSRVRSSEIPELLDRLDVGFVESAEKDAEGKKPPKPLDVVLATNMVSVGVDVQRLGLMAVSGQPKTTAEYIQATSRVGRGLPGLVVTVLNWARPRDLSHYEQFEQFHAVFYRYVEALSVTPFAARALDRGLTGVLASLVRLQTTEFNDNHGASRVLNVSEFDAVIDELGRRAQDATFPDEDSVQVGADVRSRAASRIADWSAEAAKPDRTLGYREPRKKDDVTVALLHSPGKQPWGTFTVPVSMREVEPDVGLVLGKGGDESLPAWQFTPAHGKDD
jgi:hypothetical protein